MSTLWVVTRDFEQFAAFSKVIKMKDPDAAARLKWLNFPEKVQHIYGRPNVAILGGAWEHEHFDDIIDELENRGHYRPPKFRTGWRLFGRTIDVTESICSMKQCRSERWSELGRYGRRVP